MRSCLFTFIILAPLILGISGCGLPVIGTEYAVHQTRLALQSKAPDPESNWNKYGWWKRVSDQPLIYIPKNYPATAPRTKSSGTWFVDKRDGKQLFVPTGDEVLNADARVITTKNMGIAPIRYEGQTRSENLREVFPVSSGSGGGFSIGKIGPINCPSPSGFCPSGN